MKAIGVPPTGESILKTLIELIEAQEQVKITYKFYGEEEKNEKGSSIVSNTVCVF